MNNKLPAIVILGLNTLTDEILNLENIFNVNLYNAELLTEVLKVLELEDKAVENLNIYCNWLNDDKNSNDDYRKYVEYIYRLGMVLFNVIKINQLYIDNKLNYELIEIKGSSILLKRRDALGPMETLNFRVNEIHKHLLSERRNVGLNKLRGDCA